MRVYAKQGEAWQKDDASPVTEADLRADRVIRNGLERHFPGVFILSEESVSEGPQDADRFFLIDPLDGTKDFLKRNGEFTVNIALIEGGAPIVGVVLVPALGQLFFAAQDLGAFKQDNTGVKAISTAKPLHGGAKDAVLRVMGSRSHGDKKVNDWLSTLKSEYTFVAAGSSLKFCRIAEGQADVYPRFGLTSQWDTAAAQAVLEVAGGAVIDLRGERLRYGLDRPLLNPEFLALGSLDYWALFQTAVIQP